MFKSTHLLIAATAALGVASAADAYVTHGYWNTNEVKMRASSVSFPSGSSYRTALGTIRDRFYNNPSEMWFTQQYGDTSIGFDNGQNEVWFSASSDYDPAVCFWWNSFWTPSRIVEADVVFYNGEDYTTSMNKTSLWPYNGDWRPFQTTAIHEYGHAAGLEHEDDEYNIMGEDWDHIHCNGSTCRSYVGEDACDGLVAIYGTASGGSFEDVSVANFKYEGPDDGYSEHTRCRVYNTSGLEMGWVESNGQRRYTLTRGYSYRFEFTYENNGETTQEIRIGFYRSGNSTITTSDTLIGTATLTLGRNDVYTTYHTLYIPTSWSNNTTYYIGVIVDDNNALSETDGNNNASYHIIRTN